MPNPAKDSYNFTRYGGTATRRRDKSMKSFFKYTLVLVVLCAAVCSSAPVAAQTGQISRLAMMPCVVGMPSPASAQGLSLLDCKQTDLTAEGQVAVPHAAAVVTGCLQQALDKQRPGLVVPQNETAGAEELLAYMKKTATIKAHALKLGAQVQASHVMVGTVWRYRERKGTAYGANLPASVAFSLYLLDVSSGDTVWNASFDKTQQSLSENLLDAPGFFKHGAKWLTAEELACWGAEDAAGKLKNFRSGTGTQGPRAQ
jgi:hypothetical protein